ncbi:helix-turn-helix domain-containing protein [Streptomyces avermitilis]|uniref:helix-turn-helix domain-containing protein n=1 Tax=Streptomyces avermitilis TaxID=33903 RepID=UPI0033B855A1
MPTLGYLTTERPELRLRFLDPATARIHSSTRVTEVAAVPLAQAIPQAHAFPTPGTLALVTLAAEVNAQTTVALKQLLNYLKQRRASGLVLHSASSEPHVPLSVRQQAVHLQLPLLTTTAGAEWAEANGHLQQRRAQFAERQVAHLDGLLSSLPLQFADQGAGDRIVAWLADALDVDVVVDAAERGTLSAAPDETANLAHAVLRGTPDAENVEHSQRVQIYGMDDKAVLCVASGRAFDDCASRLIRHAAKLLGLCEQARRDHHAAVIAPRSVRQAATQLFLSGNVVVGQVVANTILPALMDTPDTRVRVIDTGVQDREPTLQWCERHLRGALVSPCPGKAKQIIVITPTKQDGSIAAALRQMIGGRPGHLMGESTPQPLAASGTGYQEAAQAVRHAARSPERISVGAEPKFAPLLPRAAAQAWAQALLAPLLASEHQELLHTLPTGLSFKPTEAARGLGIHRNTLRQRLTRAGNLLGLDLNLLNDRVLVLLALDILALPAPPEGHPAVPAPDFTSLMNSEAEEARGWAEQRLRPLKADQRLLLRTVCVWLECNLSVREAAQALGLSEATVRHHTNDASIMLGMDATTTTISVHDTDVVTIADVCFAAYLLTGTPALRQPHRTAEQRPAVRH